MSAYLQQIYRERCGAAEAAANRVQELHRTILDRWQRMRECGALYSRSERQADSDALREASEQFEAVLASVYDIEDDLAAQQTLPDNHKECR